MLGLACARPNLQRSSNLLTFNDRVNGKHADQVMRMDMIAGDDLSRGKPDRLPVAKKLRAPFQQSTRDLVPKRYVAACYGRTMARPLHVAQFDGIAFPDIVQHHADVVAWDKNESDRRFFWLHDL